VDPPGSVALLFDVDIIYYGFDLQDYLQQVGTKSGD
jgi:hypothetical protein